MSFKQLGSIDIDGSTNLTGTNYTVYTVPSSSETVVSSILVLNRNSSSSAKITIYHVPSGQSVNNRYAILHQREILSGGNFINIQIGITMETGDTIIVNSDTSSVNFILWGDEKST